MKYKYQRDWEKFREENTPLPERFMKSLLGIDFTEFQPPEIPQMGDIYLTKKDK